VTSDDSVGVDIDYQWARACFVHCAREDHAERIALMQIVQKGAKLPEKLRLFVSHWPCMSCVKVLTSFKRAFPDCELLVDWP